MDYGALPPEINSGRMWAGVGSGPLVASGMAWQALAAELGLASVAMNAILAELTGASWMGPSSVAMLEAAAPFAAWLLAHSMQAEQSAIAAIGAATAFETARVGVFHPAVIAENRTELATLIATNFLGVNTPAIAANEATYSEYWAQDASVLYGYAGQMSGITGSLVPFLPPTPTTDPAGLAAQAAAVGQSAGQSAGQAAQTSSQAGSAAGSMGSGLGSMGSLASAGSQMAGAIPQMLKSLSGGGGMGGMMGSLQSLLGPLMNGGMLGGMGNMLGGVGSGVGGSLGSLGSLGGSPLSGGGSMMASLGGARSIGMESKLSVPPAWGKPPNPPLSPDRSITPSRRLPQRQRQPTAGHGLREWGWPRLAR